eukprot:4306808-Pleurochrysis_carterae.AAC.2
MSIAHSLSTFALSRLPPSPPRRFTFPPQISIINKMSTDVGEEELEPYGKADVLLSEILGAHTPPARPHFAPSPSSRQIPFRANSHFAPNAS